MNNRIFDTGEPKTKTTSIVTNGNAINGNVKNEDDGEYKFSLPPDEEGIVYQCHLCSYSATTRVNFNAHVNTHYEFQCVKCDFEDKVRFQKQFFDATAKNSFIFPSLNGIIFLNVGQLSIRMKYFCRKITKCCCRARAHM